MYERSRAIKYALGNQISCSAASATTSPIMSLLPFSSCICRASTRDGGLHFRPMNWYWRVMQNMRIPIENRREGNERIGYPEFILKSESESVILITYIYKRLEQYSDDRDTTYCQ
jgi:hypothetical protein